MRTAPISSVPAFREPAATFRAVAKTLPRQYFVSREIFSQEQKKIFFRHWYLVGHQSQVSQPGDYFLADVAGESLIVVCDKTKRIRAFYNVCRHRGSRLLETGSGRLSAGIQCPYHAWTYALDGQLSGAPQMEEAPGFDKSDYPLRAVNLGSWEGFIFVNLADSPAPLEKWFAPLAGKFSSWNLPELLAAKGIEYDVRANWKLIFENYSECYHCPGVHPELTRMSPADSAENDLTEGPFLGGFMSIRQGKSLTMSGNVCALPAGEMKSKHGARVFYYSIFPNMLLSLHPEYVMVHQLVPLSPEQTFIRCHWYFHPKAFAHHDFRPEDAVIFWDTVNRQDWRVCELSQQGVSSRGYEPGRYSPRESIPAAWDRYYLACMA
jgi:Rieske 2Fe-2S family protein